MWPDPNKEERKWHTLPGTSLLFAVNLDPDGTSFWTADLISGEVFKLDIASGTILQQWSAAGAPNFDDAAGLSIKGEITAAGGGATQSNAPVMSAWGLGAAVVLLAAFGIMRLRSQNSAA